MHSFFFRGKTHYTYKLKPHIWLTDWWWSSRWWDMLTRYDDRMRTMTHNLLNVTFTLVPLDYLIRCWYWLDFLSREHHLSYHNKKKLALVRQNIAFIRRHFVLSGTFQPFRSLYFQTSFFLKRYSSDFLNRHIALTTYMWFDTFQNHEESHLSLHINAYNCLCVLNQR